MDKNAINDIEWLKNKYLNEKMSMPEIARLLNISYKRVRTAIIRNGIKTRTRNENVAGKSRYAELNNKEWLYDLYITQRKTQREIASMLNCSLDAISSAIEKFGLKKSASEYLLERYEKNPKLSKYPLLNDKDWLYQKAIIEKLSYTDIAKIVGTTGWELVRQHLIKFDIFERRRDRPHIVGQSSYEMLNNKEWLYDQYIVNRKSTNEIAVLCGEPYPSCQIVAQSLRRNGIQVRSKKEGQEVLRDGFEIDFSDDIICIINGGLLGDASIKCDNKGTCSYQKTSIHKEYLTYEGYKILKQSPEKFISERYVDDIRFFRKNGDERTYKCQTSYSLNTYTYKEIVELEKKWYIHDENNKRTKIIPRDIKLNKESLLHWFLDDGYSYYVNRSYKTKVGEKSFIQIRIYLCTQSFVLDDLNFICDKIKNEFGLTFYPRLHRRHGVIAGTGYELELSLKDIEKFYSIIGECPVKCMEYKWKTKEKCQKNIANDNLTNGVHDVY